MKKHIIGIYDTLAMEIAGPLMTYPAEPPAIRMFGDVASHPESQVGKHITDYQLVRLGYLEEDCTITPDRAIIITGAQWKMAQMTTPTETDNG
jgi:hypothetical protein